ncbi:hypothetical protein QYF61_010599 [Mycteria americana]|uniref:Uncharacterized protein n=1 Tax=Mycteria americana TaxID=33587 RepID=A0AAN7SBV3_MYCAM|nr:hypothetical protein QYF61_010599 [Mycteria americana]
MPGINTGANSYCLTPLLINWMMCQSSFSASLQKIFAIQGDLVRLEIWADRSLMKFNKGKSKVLLLGQTNPMHQLQLGLTISKAALEKSNWGSWWTTN